MLYDYEVKIVHTVTERRTILVRGTENQFTAAHAAMEGEEAEEVLLMEEESTEGEWKVSETKKLGKSTFQYDDGAGEEHIKEMGDPDPHAVYGSPSDFDPPHTLRGEMERQSKLGGLEYDK